MVAFLRSEVPDRRIIQGDLRSSVSLTLSLGKPASASVHNNRGYSVSGSTVAREMDWSRAKAFTRCAATTTDFCYRPAERQAGSDRFTHASLGEAQIESLHDHA
jgi:hypothetical protein